MVDGQEGFGVYYRFWVSSRGVSKRIWGYEGSRMAVRDMDGHRKVGGGRKRHLGC